MAFCLALTSTSQAVAVRECALRVAIEASDVDRSELRETLKNGPLGSSRAAECDQARVRLTRTESGWNVMLLMRAEHVERNVESISAAGTWVAAWLLPRMSEPLPAESTEPGARAESQEGRPERATSKTSRQDLGAERTGASQKPAATAPPEVQIALVG
ncbi:MAG TPA: hypothetical protein VGP93_10315, partial [Polyangiaceae bacterium]|nr:hypothetical protein [Polyangiaceae bacterium]